MRFSHVDGLCIKDLTVKDPITFSMQLGYVKNFTVKNIVFDQNYGNPGALNMDGVHLDGGCCFGYIENIHGRVSDDLVAINADDLVAGPISNIFR